MNRRKFIQTGLLGGTAALIQAAEGKTADAKDEKRRHQMKPFELEEMSIAEMQAAMADGTLTAVTITQKYLSRIHDLDRNGPTVNSIIELNPDAQDIAEALDRERKATGPRGPLHGIAVVLKDNIDTSDQMMTTAGSLALAGATASRDAFVVQKLRQAGVVILGKTNMSEWANFRSSHSTSGWSGRGGLTLNPYALDRSPSGSSSGSAAAVAANFCVLAVGTETNGSILSPCSHNGLVGIKPTLGLVSRAGIIPISHSQDTAGPMARTVTDAAILLGCMSGLDDHDAVTLESRGRSYKDYRRFLKADGLRGARIGVARKFFGILDQLDQLMDNALGQMQELGAIIIDPADLPTHGQYSDLELEVLLYEFKANLNAYLTERGPDLAVHSLRELIAFNEQNKAREMPHFGQDLFSKAQAKGPLTEQSYLDALAKNRRLTRSEGIDAVMDEYKLDAMVAPTTGPTSLTDFIWGDRNTGGSTTAAAIAGYPSITVPAGQVSGLPVGISFFGRAWSEPKLLQLAFAYEQATHARKTPNFLPSIVSQ